MFGTIISTENLGCAGYYIAEILLMLRVFYTYNTFSYVHGIVEPKYL